MPYPNMITATGAKGGEFIKKNFFFSAAEFASLGSVATYAFHRHIAVTMNPTI